MELENYRKLNYLLSEIISTFRTASTFRHKTKHYFIGSKFLQVNQDVRFFGIPQFNDRFEA